MKRIILISTASLVLAGSVFGQSEHEKRKVDQQNRIAQGAASGQMTPHETAKVEGKEAKINKEVRTDKSADGGHLTGQQKAAVNRQQNRVSNQIYADKHNAPPISTGKGEVGTRRQDQQNRIANGVASGKMTAGEAVKAEHSEARTNQQIRADRTANAAR